MGSSNGHNGPGGVFLLDHFNFDVIGPWEIDRGPQELSYDFWWHLAHDVMITSEWAKPHQFEGGVVWGLTHALKSELTYERGRIQQTSYADFPVLRIDDTDAFKHRIDYDRLVARLLHGTPAPLEATQVPAP